MNVEGKLCVVDELSVCALQSDYGSGKTPALSDESTAIDILMSNVADYLNLSGSNSNINVATEDPLSQPTHIIPTVADTDAAAAAADNDASPLSPTNDLTPPTATAVVYRDPFRSQSGAGKSGKAETDEDVEMMKRNETSNIDVGVQLTTSGKRIALSL